jgi:hypothetical protein
LAIVSGKTTASSGMYVGHRIATMGLVVGFERLIRAAVV